MTAWPSRGPARRAILRVMLRSSLKSLGGEALCAAAGVDADRRAETVEGSGFLDLARASLARTA